MSKRMAEAECSRAPVPAPDFRLLFESVPGLYLVLSPDLTIVAVSDAYLRATMTKREEVLGRGIFEVFPENPADVSADGARNLTASLDRVIRERIADAMAVQKYDIRRPESEGGGFEERYWSPVNYPVIGPDQKLIYIIHRVADVTDFIRLKLHDSESEKLNQELRTRSQQMESEIFARAQEIQEANRQLRASNAAMASLHGELECRVQKRTAELAMANESLQTEFRERRTLEEQLRQAQKMEAVGLLAGGVAHDFNNLLTVISGYSDILLRSLPADDSSRGPIQEIYKAGERAAHLTRQLLAFSRKQVLEPKILDLNAIVQEVGRMLQRLIGEDISLTMTLAQDLRSVKVDPGQIEQVILNLAVNARDAMPQGGRLTIETANIELDSTYAQAHFEVKPGRYVMLAISDTGHGMEESVRTRIFEPFFTTKEPGKGTGLGLATVYGIIKQSGGNLYVYSELGRGTTFKVYLPYVPLKPSTGKSLHGFKPAMHGNETILVVEDDPAVRDMTTLSLRTYGYNVLESCHGEEAIQVCAQYHGAIHMIVTDVVMPRMGGRQVVEALRPNYPSMKILYQSGYTDDAVVRHGVLEAETAFLQKPFTPVALASKVREVLDATATE